MACALKSDCSPSSSSSFYLLKKQCQSRQQFNTTMSKTYQTHISTHGSLIVIILELVNTVKLENTMK